MNTKTTQSTAGKTERNTRASTSDAERKALVQQERLAHHLGDLVAQAEAQAAAEREAERAERREQQANLLQALRDLTGAVQGLAQGNSEVRDQMEVLHSEVKTLRAAILLAHSIGREEGSQSPLGMDVAKGERFDPFQIPTRPDPVESSAKPTNGRRTRTMSPEARAKISAFQKARWAAQREGQSSE